MSEQRGIATDKLANVIQVIQLGRKTGILHVVRGEGVQLEEGSITFTQGQIAQASSGTRTGQAALVWLSTWNACRFTFTPTEPERPTGPHSALPRTPTRTPSQEPIPSLATPPSPAMRVPYRTCSIEEAQRRLTQAGLSRTHRHLYLLVDGHRSLSELVRLIGRKPEEVQKLLYDLEYIGILRS
jgi:hypothetical protein